MDMLNEISKKMLRQAGAELGQAQQGLSCDCRQKECFLFQKECSSISITILLNLQNYIIVKDTKDKFSFEITL